MIAGGGRFALRIRVPHWATRGFSVRVNGLEAKIAAVPGTYLNLDRDWKDQDTVDCHMPMGFWLDRLMDRPRIASLFYGPILLAAEESGPRDDWRPLTLDAADLGKTITGDAGTLRFRSGDAAFRPFFESYGAYSVYLDVTQR